MTPFPAIVSAALLAAPVQGTPLGHAIDVRALITLGYVIVCPAVVVAAPDDRVSTVYQRQCDVVQIVAPEKAETAPDTHKPVKKRRRRK